MVFVYLHKVGSMAVNMAAERVAMVEYFIAVLLCLWIYIPWLLKIQRRSKPQVESNRNKKWKCLNFIWKILLHEKVRIASFSLLLLGIYAFYCSYLVYLDDQSDIIQKMQCLSLAQEQIRIRGLNNYNEWAQDGIVDYTRRDYTNSVNFFKLAFKYDLSGDQKVRNEPFYDLSKWGMEHFSVKGFDDFQDALNHMTNNISTAVNSHYYDIYNAKMRLLNTFTNLQTIKSRVDEISTNRNYGIFIQNIANTVQMLATNATYP
jgi:hypothetical protein